MNYDPYGDIYGYDEPVQERDPGVQFAETALAAAGIVYGIGYLIRKPGGNFMAGIFSLLYAGANYLCLWNVARSPKYYNSDFIAAGWSWHRFWWSLGIGIVLCVFGLWRIWREEIPRAILAQKSAYVQQRHIEKEFNRLAAEDLYQYGKLRVEPTLRK